MTTSTIGTFPTGPIEGPRAWTAASELEGVVHKFSPAAQEEVRRFVQERAPSGVLDRAAIEAVVYDPTALPLLTAEVDQVRPQVDQGIGFVVFPAWKDLDVHQSRVASWMVAGTFGETRVQDNEGRRLIEIYNADDGLSMRTGARYHETREGNSPHTDAPQRPDDPDYLCLRCVSDGLFGGESMLVTADTIHNRLLATAPDMLEALRGDFYFQCRGVDQVGGRDYFAKPVMSMDGGGLRMRFLDHYMREGHNLAGVPLTAEQERAIHGINCVFDESHLQFRALLEPGQQIVFANTRMLHARTGFADPNAPSQVYDLDQLANIPTANRLMDRTWSYKRP